MIRRIFLFVFLFFPFFIHAQKGNDYAIQPRKGWFVKGGYIRQNQLNWAELSVARFGQAQYIQKNSNIRFSAGGTALTLGSEFGFGDSAMIFAPKAGLELHLLFLGVRTSFARYFMEKKTNNCFSLEGGLCVLSVFYIYGGYNWMFGSKDSLVKPSGGKLAIGLNIPFGMKNDGQITGIGWHRRQAAPVYAFY